MKPMKAAAIYIRVSTVEQAQEGYSIQAQKDRLINYCKARSWRIADIYIDDGYSGSNLERPAIQKLLSEIESINVVLVYKLDRLSRSQKDTLHLIEDIFLENNVDFVSISESFDTSSPFGRAIMGIISVFAQLERETIKERSQMGKTERAKAGLFHGGGFAPIGYDYTEGELVINEYEALQVREVYNLYLSGLGASGIAAVLRKKGYSHKSGTWASTSAVTNVLENSIYTGKITYKGEIYPGRHEAIVSEEVFEKTQRMRSEKKDWNQKVFKSSSLLTGFLFCGHCKARYFSRWINERYKYYSCYSRSKPHSHMIKDPNCKNKNWRMEILDKIIEEEILKISIDKEYFNKLILSGEEEKNKNKSKKKIIEKKINELEKQINKLMDLYQVETIPIEEISRRIERLYEEKKELALQVKESSSVKENPYTEEAVKILKDLNMLWNQASIEEKRNLLRSLIKKITLENEKINIEWTFA